ncbi:MAG: carbohydrate ABC transporter permease [Clostridia bacterium]|nr:carbohydrate ABC transporter permease [Clostridia bacterium]
MKQELATKKIKKKEKAQEISVYDAPLWVKGIAYFITSVLAISAILPFLLTVAISFTDEASIMAKGYSLFPEKFSLEGYKYLFTNGAQIARSYGVTIFITIVGTLGGLLVISLLAYVISRPSFPWRKQFTFVALFTMLFSGGLLPSYIINTTVYQYRDNIHALIIGHLMNTTYLLIMRTYMANSIPGAVIESAKIDGAKDFTCYWKIVLPMATPVLGTIGIFLVVAIWNDWYTGFLYITSNTDIMPIQLLLQRMEKEVQFLQNNAAQMGASEVMAVQATLPSETFRMCLVVIVVTPILVAYPFFQRFFVNGITIGSVKG